MIYIEHIGHMRNGEQRLSQLIALRLLGGFVGARNP